MQPDESAPRTWRDVAVDGPATVRMAGYVVGGDRAVAAAVASADFGALQGSFLLRIEDGRTVRHVTDRTGSRRAFLHRTSAGDEVRDDERPVTDAELDLGAIGCILANGYPLRGATLHRGVSALEAGSVTTVVDGSADVAPYWRFDPRADPGLSAEAARSDLADLLLDAVDRHVPEGVLLSLSAGYDARGILGILRHRLGRSDVSAFSYAHGIPAPGSDAALSADLARTCGYPHRVVESVEDDLLRVFSDNARMGRGLANFCDEVRVWTTEVGHDRPLVVGDECFGWNDVPLDGPDDVLEAVYLHRSSGLRRLRGLVDDDVLDTLGAATDALVDDALAPHLDRTDLHDAKDSLYFTERLSRGLMAWRESFAGAGRVVLNPFLDGDVLDLIARLPSSERRGKRLYRETVRDLVPEVFSVPFASTMGYSPDWRALMVADADRLRATLATPSRLDAVIAPEAVDRLITRCGSATSRGRDQVARVGAALRARQRFAAAGRLVGWEVNDPTLLRRLLVLRSTLSV